MKIYYWNNKKNFGDALSSFLIERFTGISSQWASPENSQLVMCGSILEHLPSNYTGVIAGAGKLHQHSKIHFPKARILALRGPLTAKGMKGNYILADPGLLADELVSIPEKKYDLGIVPHWTDKTLEHTPALKKYSPKIIRVSDNPLDVIRQIGECKKIVSSSLHGIILADAFGIPRRIEIPPRSISHPHQEGGLFKWHDYSASLNLKLEIGKTIEVERNKITEKQHEIFDVMDEIKNIYS
jgi:pyruvyltransferase